MGGWYANTWLGCGILADCIQKWLDADAVHTCAPVPKRIDEYPGRTELEPFRRGVKARYPTLRIVYDQDDEDNNPEFVGDVFVVIKDAPLDLDDIERSPLDRTEWNAFWASIGLAPSPSPEFLSATYYGPS